MYPKDLYIGVFEQKYEIYHDKEELVTVLTQEADTAIKGK